MHGIAVNEDRVRVDACVVNGVLHGHTKCRPHTNSIDGGRLNMGNANRHGHVGNACGENLSLRGSELLGVVDPPDDRLVRKGNRGDGKRPGKCAAPHLVHAQDNSGAAQLPGFVIHRKHTLALCSLASEPAASDLARMLDLFARVIGIARVEARELRFVGGGEESRHLVGRGCGPCHGTPPTERDESDA